MARPDYGRARWYGSNSNGYQSANRPNSTNINKIIVHITQGSWSSAINWFDDPRSGVSTHYVVRSSDGFIGQCVQEKDIAYHAGNWPVNQTSIGIEHEGYGNESRWLTPDLYNSSARLAAHLANKYDIPINRTHFKGHKQVSSTQCPGNYWDWDRYLRLVRSYSGSQNTEKKQYEQIINNSNPSRFRASASWGVSSYSSQKNGNNYRYANPVSRYSTDYAMFKARIPKKGKYGVWAWWPANSGYSGSARFLIRTTNGWASRYRSQRKNGGRWVKLGEFTMESGDGWFIRVDKRNNFNDYIIADAVMIRSV